MVVAPGCRHSITKPARHRFGYRTSCARVNIAANIATSGAPVPRTSTPAADVGHPVPAPAPTLRKKRLAHVGPGRLGHRPSVWTGSLRPGPSCALPTASKPWILDPPLRSANRGCRVGNIKGIGSERVDFAGWAVSTGHTERNPTLARSATERPRRSGRAPRLPVPRGTRRPCRPAPLRRPHSGEPRR